MEQNICLRRVDGALGELVVAADMVAVAVAPHGDGAPPEKLGNGVHEAHEPEA